MQPSEAVRCISTPDQPPTQPVSMLLLLPGITCDFGTGSLQKHTTHCTCVFGACLTALNNNPLKLVQASRFAVCKQPEWGSPWMFRGQSIQSPESSWLSHLQTSHGLSLLPLYSFWPAWHISLILPTLSFLPSLPHWLHYCHTPPWLCVSPYSAMCRDHLSFISESSAQNLST